VELVGGPRTGKTTALAHLASLPVADRLVLVDDAWPADLPLGVSDRLVVYTKRSPLDVCDLSYELAAWCDDDLIEYLLSTHPDRCSFVMARFTADGCKGLLDGKPELFCIVAEQMAADESVRDIRTALRRGIAERVRDEQTLKLARLYSAAALLGMQQLAEERALEIKQLGVGDELFGPLSHRLVQLLLAADQAISTLKEGCEHPFPMRDLPRVLVEEVAQLAKGDPTVLRRLQELVDGGREYYAPMAASILHFADKRWRPNCDCRTYLSGAIFSAARWRGIDLNRLNLESADLNRSDLRGGNLTLTLLTKASLRDSNLEAARLGMVSAHQADFSEADLTGADMFRGRFLQAHFARSMLNQVTAAQADFRGADLRTASLRAASLQRCDFRDAMLDGADFQDAHLQGADLSEQQLRNTILRAADLSKCNLSRCNLEFLELPGARLNTASLVNAWLTGSVMRGADLRNACIRGARLAEVDWEGADLRGADLRGCSFHLGSSRSGLVGSPYPCHGTRTGFYTNDYDAQSYKAPETIRKANLCGADLRGALIAGVDFYLVDLRGARYDRQQAAHFRRCDAILFDRAT
jgi:uncharacterized protein YjbI with pentapeptide repeats